MNDLSLGFPLAFIGCVTSGKEPTRESFSLCKQQIPPPSLYGAAIVKPFVGPNPHPRGLSPQLVQGAPDTLHPRPLLRLPLRSPLELQAEHLTKKAWPRTKGIFRFRLRSSGPQLLLICVLRTTAFSLKRGFRWKAMSFPERRLMWNLGVGSSYGSLPTECWAPAPPSLPRAGGGRVARMTWGISPPREPRLTSEHRAGRCPKW